MTEELALNKEDIFRILGETIPEKDIIIDCDMSGMTSFKAGGKAGALISPENTGQLRKTLMALSETGVPYIVVGNGTNVLFTDRGFPGVAIKIGGAFSRVSADGDELYAGAGALLSEAAVSAMEAGLSGLEFASGIPGSVGGAVFMNAGAYGSEIKDIVKCVDTVAKDGSGEFTLKNDEMGFSYRRSVIQSNGNIITGATFKLTRGSSQEIKERMRVINNIRNEKQPVAQPSAGSFFKRPHGYYAGKLIEDAGLKGLSIGGAMVSALHAGFIVNSGNATAADIIDLMEVVREAVRDKFGVRLEPEVRIIGD